MSLRGPLDLRMAGIVILHLAVAGCVLRPTVPPVSPECLEALAGMHDAPATRGPVVPSPQPDLDGVHPIDFYLRLALRQNPAIRAAERRAAAFFEEVPQVTALPDPMVQNTFWPIPANSPQTASGRMANSLTLSQQFPWIGKLRLKGEIATQEAHIALADLAEEQLRVGEAVKSTYYELLFFQDALRITEENEQLLRRYIALAESQYKVGKASQQDVLRAQVELARLQDQRIGFEREKQTTQADLARLLSISPDTNLLAAPLPALAPIPRQVEELYQLAIAARPELKGRLLAITRDEQRAELANLAYYPDVTLGMNWGLLTADQALARTANGYDNFGLMVGFNLPIRKQKLAAGVRQAWDRRAESQWKYEAARDETLRMIRRLTAQARAFEQQLKLVNDEILPKLERAFRVSEADYRVGKVDALQVIDNFTQMLRFRIQESRLRSGIGQTLASLERAVGVELAAPDAPAPPAPGQPAP